MGFALLQPQEEDKHTVATSLISAFPQARPHTVPYRYWLLQDMLPLEKCRQVITLPIAAANVYESFGKRDSYNDLRRFFSPELQALFPVMAEIASAFQSEAVVRTIENLCAVSLNGTYLRIEYCQDRDGFWLEPHMDIKEKKITIQLYLNEGENADTLGTDIYNPDKSYFGTVCSRINHGMAFVPSEPGSYHGFSKRFIPDIRRSLIINYVTDNWRARHELCFPQTQIHYQ